MEHGRARVKGDLSMVIRRKNGRVDRVPVMRSDDGPLRRAWTRLRIGWINLLHRLRD